MKNKILFKHIGSCLGDMAVEYEIDERKKVVLVLIQHFDSALFMSLIEHLESKYGIRAYADDNDGWLPKRPEWQLLVQFGHTRYRAEVARLVDLTDGKRQDFAVALVPDAGSKLKLLDVVQLLAAQAPMPRGSRGTVIELLDDKTMLVEFVGEDGVTVAEIPVERQLLRVAEANDDK